MQTSEEEWAKMVAEWSRDAKKEMKTDIEKVMNEVWKKLVRFHIKLELSSVLKTCRNTTTFA